VNEVVTSKLSANLKHNVAMVAPPRQQNRDQRLTFDRVELVLSMRAKTVDYNLNCLSELFKFRLEVLAACIDALS